MKIFNVVGILLAVSLRIESSLISQCPEGHKKPLAGHCNKYLECLNNSWQEKQCSESNYMFDARTNICRDRREVRCENACGKGQIFNFDKNECIDNGEDVRTSFSDHDGNECESGSIEPIPGSCNQFYRCVKGKRVEKKCWFFENFDPETLKCDYKWNVNCKLDTQCISGEKVPSGNCREYYQCEYGYWKRRDCGTSIGLPMYFDTNSKDCMIVGSTCSSVECSVEGLKRDLPTDCSKYQVCHHGHFYEKSCGWFQKYDSDKNECKYIGVDCTASQNLPDCTDGERRSIDGSCYSYKKCIKGQFEKRYCFYPLYRFDKDSKTCTFMGTCNNQCYKNEVLPVSGRCDQFYICRSGKYEIQTCPQGNDFDVVTSTCMDPKYATCGSSISKE